LSFRFFEGVMVRGFLFGFGFVVFSFFADVSAVVAESSMGALREIVTESKPPTDSKLPKNMKCRKLLKFLVGSLVTLGAVHVPDVYHDLKASGQGYRHIGSGIYLDRKGIEEALPEPVRDLIQSYRSSTASEKILKEVELAQALG